QVHAEQKAVMERTGRVSLYLNANCSALHTVRRSPKHGCLEVDAVALDDYFIGNSRSIDIVKIDVEGAEFSVLKGMTELIKQSRKLRVFLEFVPAWVSDAGHSPEECLTLLCDHGFALYDVSDEARTVTQTTVAEMLERYPREQKGGTNLWCVKT